MQSNRNAMPPGTNPTLTYGDSPASGPAPHTAGHHRHDILNKLDPSVNSSRDKVPLPPPGAASNGPHSSRLANKLDPRVDTRAYEAASASAAAGYVPGSIMDTHGPTMHGGIAGPGSGGAPEGTYGPHTSRMANAMDPRVDSDRDGRGTYGGGAGAGYQQHGGYGNQQPAGGYGHQQPAGGYGHQQPAGGYGHAQQSGYGYPQQQEHPQQHSVEAWYGQPQQQYGGGAQQGYGVGHEQYGTRHRQEAATLPGPAPHTAGPHRSDLLNKLDPAVDSKGGTVTSERAQRRGI